MEDIAKEAPDPLRRDTLSYLSWYGIPESRLVLETLAKGLPQARLTKEATAALCKLRQPTLPP